MFHDFKISLNDHLEIFLAKVNRGFAILRKLQSVLPTEALLNVYKLFICPHFDYGDVIINRTTIHFMRRQNPTNIKQP